MITSAFVHIGDTHLRPGARREDIVLALKQIILEGSRVPNLGAWLWPGDLFDGRTTDEDINTLDQLLLDMAVFAPVLIDYGNHDHPGSLDSFARLKGAHPIRVFDQPVCDTIKLATGQWATIFHLPYPNKARLVAAGVGKADVVAMGGDLLEPIFMAAAHDLEQARARGDITLMTGHINVAGARTSTGQPNIGHEIELSPRHLDRLGPVPKLLNHIHYGQTVHAETYYAGSVCRMNWGEVEPKRYLVVTAFASSAPIGCSYHVDERPIDVPPMYHVEGELTREGFTWELSADQPPPTNGAAIDWTGCEVRVRYRFKASEREVLDHERVAREFAGAARFKPEPLAVPDRDIRAPEIANEHTIPGKVAAYLKAPLSPGMAGKVAALEHEEPAAVLAGVDAQLAALETREEGVAAA